MSVLCNIIYNNFIGNEHVCWWPRLFFSAAYSNSYHSFWERIQPRSKSTNFNLFWVKYHSFSVKNYDNLVSVSLVIVLQKGCVPIAQWRNAAPNFFNIFCLYYWGRQFSPPLELFKPYFFHRRCIIVLKHYDSDFYF